MWYTYTVECYSAKTVPFAETWIDLETVIRNEISYIKINIICYQLNVESRKMVQMNLFAKQK